MAMLADCVPEPGKLSGPAHHVLCRTHGHVLDRKAEKIIAWSPADYRKRFPLAGVNYLDRSTTTIVAGGRRGS